MNDKENMNKAEETEYNDIESLAAFLHSGKMQEERSAGEREEMGLPPESEEVRGSSELEGVLFSIEGRNRSHASLMTPDPEPDFSESPKRRKNTVKADPSVPANPIMRAENGTAERHTAARPRPKKQEHGSFAENAKKKLDSIVSGAKNKLDEIKENASEKEREKAEYEEITETESAPVKHEKPERPAKSPKHERPRPAADEPREEIPALAASLSAALGEKAAEIVEQRRNELPPEDIPEVFDIEEGSDEEEEFDNTATRLMNAVNDPHARSISMKDDADEEEEEERAERIMAARLRLNYERQKQSTRTLAYILIALLLCAAILGAAAYASTYIVKWALDFTGVASTEFQLDVTIPDDANIDTVAAILSENNIISDAKFFKFYSEFADKLKKDETPAEFIGGKYTVSSTMSYSTLLSILRTKESVRKTISVRIVEGMTAHDIAVLLEENNVCFAEDFEKYYKNIQNNYDFERRVKENSLKFNQLEGYLFPDTYEFYVVNEMENGGKPEKGQTVEEAYEKTKKASEENAMEAARKMYSNFNSKITRSMYKKMGEMHFTLDDTIALASMVQKEAASEEDMGNVASVFLNRIRNSGEFPYLQSDVTVLYVENEIKPYINGTDAFKQRIFDAYNTYTCTGIPAGAVCNPGISAINAVLYAPETPYFYFCANEETGEIYYAQTHEEHEQNLILAGLTAGEQTSPEPYGEGSGIE
ncbi:MAG: endolytic transglycosylase MltG [Ruminiclostridium sp.]|nr:endolytic transglycosylase MltG [Ruminiclostridium sp.]